MQSLKAARSLLSVSGPDAARFLQGALTANILKLGSQGGRFTSISGLGAGGTYAAFLTAQGRVLYDVFVYADTLGAGGDKVSREDSFLIEVDSNEAKSLQEHIKRYKLRAKFETRIVDDGELEVFHAWEDKSLQPPADGSSVELIRRLKEGLGGQRAITLLDGRAPNLGYRVVVDGSSLPQWESLQHVSTSEYVLHRYMHGIAEGQGEILKGQALPQESNLDCTGAIDWRKGCYVGQELTIRTKHRGVVRKRILPCMLYLDSFSKVEAVTNPLRFLQSPPSPSSELNWCIPTGTSIDRIGTSGRSAGKWLCGVGRNGLALCRLETMTDVVLPGETTASTYSPEDEFMLRVEGSNPEDQAVKVVAVVPDWLRDGINA